MYDMKVPETEMHLVEVADSSSHCCSGKKTVRKEEDKMA